MVGCGSHIQTKVPILDLLFPHHLRPFIRLCIIFVIKPCFLALSFWHFLIEKNMRNRAAIVVPYRHQNIWEAIRVNVTDVDSRQKVMVQVGHILHYFLGVRI